MDYIIFAIIIILGAFVYGWSNGYYDTLTKGFGRGEVPEIIGNRGWPLALLFSLPLLLSAVSGYFAFSWWGILIGPVSILILSTPVYNHYHRKIWDTVVRILGKERAEEVYGKDGRKV